MVLAAKLRKQLRADPDSWSDSHANPVQLPNIARLVADGRASVTHQFKLSQGLAPPRQFLPRTFGQNPEYSVSANREAIDWFDNHPQPSFTTSTSTTAPAPLPSEIRDSTYNFPLPTFDIRHGRPFQSAYVHVLYHPSMDHGSAARLTSDARGMGVSDRRNPIPTYPATSF
jgi:hypothetical protein